MNLIKSARIMALALLSLTLLISSSFGSENEPKTSYKFIVVYGTGDLEVGDVVEFFDPEGMLCGKWVVRDKGAYGLMAVYGDDPTTEEVDEGPGAGEVLTIKVNGIEVIASGSPPVFENEGETRRIDI